VRCLLACLSCLICCCAAYAQEDCVNCSCERSEETVEFFGPQRVSSQLALHQLFLCPEPESAYLSEAEGGEWSFRADLSNTLLREMDDGVIQDMDFEQLRLSAEYRRRIGRSELKLNQSLILRGDGKLDGLAGNLHDFFGLVSHYRNEFPDYQHRYVIATRAGVLHHEADEVTGAGDLVLGCKHLLLQREQDALALRVALKLPTGDADEALGSGSADAQLGLLYARQFGERWRAYANLDYVFVGEPQWEGAGWRNAAGAVLGVEYAAAPGTSCTAQFTLQQTPLLLGSPVADSTARLLNLGFHHRLSERSVFSASITEEMYPASAPDFVLSAELRLLH
jgi:hypothetical protein